jgi:hypothetical protein
VSGGEVALADRQHGRALGKPLWVAAAGLGVGLGDPGQRVEGGVDFAGGLPEPGVGGGQVTSGGRVRGPGVVGEPVQKLEQSG